jgi:polysaccharide chain length determinant protein (PEP-CTERM system associated)
MEETTMTLPQLLEVMRRRRLSLILPTVLIFLLGVAAALLWPSIYKSTATIMVQEQEVSTDLIKTTVTSYAEQRIQQINKRIMSFSRLLDVIKEHDPYPELKAGTEALVEKMRKDTELLPVRGEMIDRRTGMPIDATLAFTLSYQGRNPQKVYELANVMVSLLLEENVKERVKVVEDTTDFLESELRKLNEDLAAQESKLADYRLRNINELPELLSSNTQALTHIERDLQNLTNQLRGLKEREVYYQAQLAGLKPRLKDEEELVTRKALEDLKVQLVSMQQRLSDSHPDVKKIRSEIKYLEEKMKDATGRAASAGPPDNPVYVTMAAQLAGARTDIQSIQRQIEVQTAEAANIRRRIAATPRVEQEYGAMVAQRNSTQTKINELMRKLMDSRVARGLEKEQKGERFTLIEPPRLPKTPFKPNRPAIILISLVLGIGAGVGLAALREFVDDAVHNADQLEAETKFPVLVGIPVIVTAFDIAQNRRRRLTWVGAAAASAVIAVAVVHFVGMDLDVFWQKLVGVLPL